MAAINGTADAVNKAAAGVSDAAVQIARAWSDHALRRPDARRGGRGWSRSSAARAPLLRWLFPEVPPGTRGGAIVRALRQHARSQQCSQSTLIKAMEELQTRNPEKETATNGW